MKKIEKHRNPVCLTCSKSCQQDITSRVVKCPYWTKIENPPETPESALQAIQCKKVVKLRDKMAQVAVSVRLGLKYRSSQR